MPPSVRTPKSLGYSFPPEWARHSGTWISWPRPEGISFPERYRDSIEDVIRVIATIAQFEPVHLNVPNANYRHIVRDVLEVRGVPLAPRSASTRSRPTSAGRAITGRRSCCARDAAAPRRPWSTGASTPGAASTRRSTPTMRSRRGWPRAWTCPCSIRASSWRAAPWTSTAKAPSSRPRRVCSTRTATRRCRAPRSSST